MTPLEEIVQAFKAIDTAEQNYRDLLRRHLAEENVQQAEVVRALNRTREMIRRDAMTDEQRAALRKADAERRRAARGTKQPRKTATS